VLLENPGLDLFLWVLPQTDVHYLTITLRPLEGAEEVWILIDEESLTDWEQGNQTSFKGGFLLGLMLSRRAGVSLKTEIPFGAHRKGEWTSSQFLLDPVLILKDFGKMTRERQVSLRRTGDRGWLFACRPGRIQDSTATTSASLWLLVCHWCIRAA